MYRSHRVLLNHEEKEEEKDENEGQTDRYTDSQRVLSE
jgi:hypothetical protein